MLRRLALFLLVVLLALIAASPATTYSSPEGLNGVASWLAMRAVTTRCLTEEEAAADPVIVVMGAEAYVSGWRDGRGAWHPYNYAVFNFGVCQPLEALQAGDASEYSVDQLAWSLLVLTHESGHLRGHRWSADESMTECWAVRHVGYVADRMGVTDPLLRQALVAGAVLLHKSLPPQYQLSYCRLPGE